MPFFIMVANSPHLDNSYASFGKVTAGLEEVDRIVNSPRDFRDKPQEDQRIKEISVDTHGVDYEDPTTTSR